MSERAAKSCNGKKRHDSQRRASESAVQTQKVTGVAMTTYPCEFCKGWHVGSVKMDAPSLMSRKEKVQKYTNYDRDRAAKSNFGRIR